jgi:hypothetical protein
VRALFSLGAVVVERVMSLVCQASQSGQCSASALLFLFGLSASVSKAGHSFLGSAPESFLPRSSAGRSLSISFPGWLCSVLGYFVAVAVAKHFLRFLPWLGLMLLCTSLVR